MRTRQLKIAVPIKPAIPKKFKYLFWDVDSNSLDLQENKYFIIERMLEKGDFHAIAWLINAYKLDSIKKIIYTPINLSTKTINFWVLYFKHC